MRQPLLLIFLFLFLDIGGCATMPVRPVVEQEPTPAMQRDIYRSIAAEVKMHLQAAEALQQKGELYQALLRYRQAAFFDEDYGLAAIIAGLEGKIEEESDQLYAAGQQALAEDEGEALKAFNGALALNPEHQAARRARDLLLAMPDIQSRLAREEDLLLQAWRSYTASPEGITRLAARAAAVLACQYEHQLARAAQERAEKDRTAYVRRHLTEGLALFAEGELQNAKTFLQRARAVEPENHEVTEALCKIQKQQDLEYLLNLSRYRLEKRELEEAAAYADQAGAIEPDHAGVKAVREQILLSRADEDLRKIRWAFAQKQYEEGVVHLQRLFAGEAKSVPQVQQSARELLDRQLPQMVEEGRQLFEQNRLEEADRIIACALALAPGNAMASTYHKKIRNRLQTLQSLR